jgi:hypothetical protein
MRIAIALALFAGCLAMAPGSASAFPLDLLSLLAPLPVLLLAALLPLWRRALLSGTRVA